MSVLKIHTTYRCTSTCAHCHLRAGIDRPDKSISHDLTLTAIRDLQRLNNLELVVFLGGEPGLYPDLLHQLAAGPPRPGRGAESRDQCLLGYKPPGGNRVSWNLLVAQNADYVQHR